MFVGYGFCIVAAICVGSIAAMIHASGHAPIGLTSLGVGIALGLAAHWIAVWLKLARGKRFLFFTAGLALVTVFFEHDCLYLDFCRQWHESRANSPQVAMFRSKAPPSPAEYFSRQWTPQQAALWSFDAVVIVTSAVTTIFLLQRRPRHPTPDT